LKRRRKDTRHEPFRENLRVNVLEITPDTLGFKDFFSIGVICVIFIFGLGEFRRELLRKKLLWKILILRNSFNQN